MTSVKTEALLFFFSHREQDNWRQQAVISPAQRESRRSEPEIPVGQPWSYFAISAALGFQETQCLENLS